MEVFGEHGRRIGAGAAALVAAFGAEAAGWPAPVQAVLGFAALGLAVFLIPSAAPRPSAPPDEAPPARRPLEPGLGRVALERLPNPLLLIEANGAIVYANPAARRFFERLRVGEHYSTSFRAPDFLDAIADALSFGASRSFDFTLHGDRNRAIRAHVDGGVLAPGAEASGRRHALCLFEDRTHDVRVARMRTDFIANASHELRTPLSSIKGFIETLQGPAREDADARDRFLAIMQAQAERMQRLVDDLLSLNRIELNEHVAPTETLDLGELANETAEALAPMARARGARIVCRVPLRGPKVRGDRDQLIQALGNLLENALKYGAGSPVELSLADPSPDHPGMIGLTVSDSGEGIPHQHIPRLTERFYRVSVKRSRDQGGTGLGLAIVKHILSRHRGELSIASEIGKGSRFTLRLPGDRSQPSPDEEPAAASREPAA